MSTDPDLGLDATLASPTTAADTPAALPASPRKSLDGYQFGAVLGRGGMGEISLVHDDRIGRDIAVKRMRAEAPTPEQVGRFLREARIQARLEHPAIVPVHDLGQDDAGRPYFTMKRLAGVTLAELLAATPRPSLQRLLRAFADVCNAVEFAHSRGVIHRDVKPANVMLGDFGEVYVLDWGLARTVGESEEGTIGADIASLDGMTKTGAVLGTPGYMAPEQVTGERDVGRPADVYALGSILFEILAGESLHPPGNAALLATLANTETSPIARRPAQGIPPELDALCVAALVRDPGGRTTARELADRVEGYLDGDRDLERRRTLAGTWLATARAALAADDVGRRAEALQHAGRALALDPDAPEALALFTRLIVEPPARLPAELRTELALADAVVQRRQSRVAALSFIAIVGFLVMVSWNGVRSAGTLVAIAGLTAVMAASAYVLSRRPARAVEMVAIVVGNATLAAALSRVFGSMLIAPAVTCVMAVSLTSYPQLIDRAKVVLAVLVVSWLAPVGLEAAGVLSTTWTVTTGKIEAMSPMIAIAPGSATAILIVSNVITFVVIGLFANALARSRRDAMRRVEIQAWHLRHLVPAPIASA